jgi:hypothetical protein
MSKRKVKLVTEGPFVQVATTESQETVPEVRTVQSTPDIVPTLPDRTAHITQNVSGTVSVDGLTDLCSLIGSSLTTQSELLEAVNGVRMDIQVLQELQVNKDEEGATNKPFDLSEVDSLIKIRTYISNIANSSFGGPNRATVNAAAKMIPLLDTKLMTVLMGADFTKYLGQ